MTMLRERYLAQMEQNAPAFYNENYQTHKLKERLVNRFGERIKFWQPNYRSELVYASEIEVGAAVEMAFESATSERKLYEDVALSMRRHIIHKQNLSPEMPWPPSADFLQSGNMSPPDCLVDFLRVVLTGKTVQGNDKCERNAKTIAEDICAAATRGK